MSFGDFVAAQQMSYTKVTSTNNHHPYDLTTAASARYPETSANFFNGRESQVSLFPLLSLLPFEVSLLFSGLISFQSLSLSHFVFGFLKKNYL